jgi:CTP:molybdopterin cytidylyltransferase MocA
MEDIVIVIPAAGASSRMRGGDKLLEEIGGEPLLRRMARIAAGTGAKVIVTLPEGGPHMAPRRAELTGLAVRMMPVRDAHEGMAASLRAGVGAAGSAVGLMVMLPDMPDITDADLRTLMAAFSDQPTATIRATTAEGEPGHPVIFPRRLFAELGVLTGDTGGKRVLIGEDVRPCPLPGRHAVTDLDTPEAWAAWRAQHTL